MSGGEQAEPAHFLAVEVAPGAIQGLETRLGMPIAAPRDGSRYYFAHVRTDGVEVRLFARPPRWGMVVGHLKHCAGQIRVESISLRAFRLIGQSPGGHVPLPPEMPRQLYEALFKEMEPK